jgi:two-component system NarL family sensor kinase
MSPTHPSPRRRPLLRLSYGQQIFALTTIPLVLAAAAIALLVNVQSNRMAERELAALETTLIETKKDELKNYLSLARTAFVTIYGNAAPDDALAKLRVTQILSAMLYSQDGYFFVYDYDGTNLVSPRQTQLIGRKWTGMTDAVGVPVTDTLITLARSGGGYHTYEWEKPSTGETATMITYVIGLQDWQWAIGTGVFIDDVLASVAAARAETQARVQQTFVQIGLITGAALLAVFLSGLFINIRERRLADTKLKALTQRVLDTQEQERGRVARELHDGISQILVGVRYRLELAKRLTAKGDAGASKALDESITGLQGAIGEVRRISRDLRPGVLDDLGLGPAIKALAEEFSGRTGIPVTFHTVVFRNRLDVEARNALYRIAQEALTNIERHAEATAVTIRVAGHRKGATLSITDNGRGLPPKGAARTNRIGLGLRNMQERVEQLDGTLRVTSSEMGTQIEADVPLSHLLAPETRSGAKSIAKTAKEGMEI